MPMAKQARQIWTEKLGPVHPLPFRGVIFREIGHLATIPFFGQISAKKVQIIKHEWTPEIHKIKLYCIVIILYRMHTKKNKNKTYLSQSSCNPLDAIIVSHVHKTTRPLPKFRAANQSKCTHLKEISPPQYHIYILIIHSGPVAKQARQIWTEKLGPVHPLPFRGVIFREIGHLATIPFFGQISAKKVQIIKHEWTPEIHKIKLYCIVIILYRMHTKKNKNKTYLSQSSCNPLDAIIVSHVHKTTRPLPKFRAANQSKCTHLKEISPPQYHIYILIIHSGPVARTVPIYIKIHGQDSSTSQLESIRFKYLRLK